MTFKAFKAFKAPRPLLALAMAVAVAFSGVSVAVADTPQLPPGITLPPRAPDTSTSTSTAAASQTSTSVAPAPTAAAPTPTAPPDGHTGPKAAGLDGKPGAAGTSPGSPSGPAPTSTPTTAAVDASANPGPDATRGPSPTKASVPGALPPAIAATPRSSLSPGQVDAVLRDQQRSGANSTVALVDALRPLQNFGMTLEEALGVGMGRFPVLGVANWTDDWLDPRAGPPPHQHMGNDIFAAFDVPVRSPVDGVVRFEDAGLGGKGAFVTAPDGTYYYMAHLNGFNRDLASGSPVTQGQIVGYNGDSGNAKGGAPHVHFQIHPGGGAAVNPKPTLDAWVAEALAKVPELIASFSPGDPAATVDAGEGPPPILMTTGLTRRFSAPSVPAPGRDRAVDFNRAVLAPLTPSALASLLGR